MIEYASFKNIYLNINNMIATKTKRKTQAPTDPITASKCGSADSDSSKKVICFKKKRAIGI